MGSSGGNRPTQGLVYPLSAYNWHSASVDPTECQGNAALDNGYFARIFVPAGKAITTLGTIVKTAGTVGAGGLNGFKVFDDTGAGVAATVDDNNLFTAAGWVTKALGSPIAAQGADRYVWVGVASKGYTAAPVILFAVTGTQVTDGGGNSVTHRRGIFSSITSWPASFTPASYGSSLSGFLPLIVLG